MRTYSLQEGVELGLELVDATCDGRFDGRCDGLDIVRDREDPVALLGAVDAVNSTFEEESMVAPSFGVASFASRA